ncbi:single-stranded DNA-binding protein, partial [Pseudomonas aeruginosa]
TWQINARSVGILPFRIESVVLSPKSQETAQDAQPKPQAAQEPAAPKEPKRRK